VDGNVRRVLARLAGDPDFDDAEAWSQATALVRGAARPGAVNEGLMELGATVCTPRQPKCEACPAADLCVARRRGVQDRIPAPRARAARRSVHHHTVVMVRGRRVLLEQRGDDGLWSGMWQTPTVEAEQRLSADQVVRRLPFAVSGMEACGSFVHQTTHREVSFHVYRGRSRVRSGVWREPEEMEDLPLSNAHKRVLEMAVSC
jgi:A/G-specific adenine glycosylase